MTSLILNKRQADFLQPAYLLRLNAALALRSEKQAISPADIGVILVGPRFGVHTKCFDIFG